jgi:hypothetical protein
MHAVWNNGKFVCPVSTAIWADQQEAQAGNDDYVYCIEVR